MYEQQILRILLDVGEPGISVKKLAKHVYNHYCTLFFQPDFREVYRYVQQYVQRNSRSQNGLIEHTEKWGRYRLNTSNTTVRQILLEFKDKVEEKDEVVTAPAKDLSLDLFSSDQF